MIARLWDVFQGDAAAHGHGTSQDKHYPHLVYLRGKNRYVLNNEKTIADIENSLRSNSSMSAIKRFLSGALFFICSVK